MHSYASNILLDNKKQIYAYKTYTKSYKKFKKKHDHTHTNS